MTAETTDNDQQTSQTVAIMNDVAPVSVRPHKSLPESEPNFYDVLCGWSCRLFKAAADYDHSCAGPEITSYLQ
jgi:hypothetical protein